MKEQKQKCKPVRSLPALTVLVFMTFLWLLYKLIMRKIGQGDISLFFFFFKQKIEEATKLLGLVAPPKPEF